MSHFTFCYAECYHAGVVLMNVIMLSVVMLTVNMPNGIMLSVLAHYIIEPFTHIFAYLLSLNFDEHSSHICEFKV